MTYEFGVDQGPGMEGRAPDAVCFYTASDREHTFLNRFIVVSSTNVQALRQPGSWPGTCSCNSQAVAPVALAVATGLVVNGEPPKIPEASFWWTKRQCGKRPQSKCRTVRYIRYEVSRTDSTIMNPHDMNSIFIKSWP